jgi:hypothetical protein
MTYTVLDGAYEKGMLRRIEGQTGGPALVNNPTDTGYGLDPKADGDPMVYSYIGADGTAHILLVRVNSVSLGDTTYTVLKPVVGASNLWQVYENNGKKLENIKFTLSGAAVLGNPQSLAQVKVGNDRFIYLVEYDSGRVYGINVADFETGTWSATSVEYALTPALSVVGINPPSGFTSHGVSIIALQVSGSHFLFALYMTVDDPWANAPNYQQSTLVKLSVGSSGALTAAGNVVVGRNATGLVPVGSGANLSLLVPAIGGKQNYGANNGSSSNIYKVPVSLTGMTIPLTGGPLSSSLTVNSTYDIKMVAASSDGSNIYVLTGCYSTSYDTFWRLYKLSLSDLNGSNVPLNNSSIAAKAVDSSSGAPGYYWAVLYENSAGRLWFLKGSPIIVTPGSTYPTNPVPTPPSPPSAQPDDYRYFDIGYVDGTIGGMNVNSVDLTGEMVALAKTDVSVSTIFRAYQPPHVVSGAFRNMADFIRYEKARKLYAERLERERTGKSDLSAAQFEQLVQECAAKFEQLVQESAAKFSRLVQESAAQLQQK